MSGDLVVNLQSFSYRSGLPSPASEHGGGFVFDCRALKNPGREEQYKSKSGLDADVIHYLEQLPEANKFFDHVFALVELAIQRYQTRQFESMEVAFGCTGGQHRSVYFAERLARHLQTRKGVKVVLTHRDLPEEFRP